MKPLVLDLFSGTKSMRQPALDMGLDYFSVDNDPSLEPDMVADIGKISFQDIGIGVHPYIVWASPPCTHFSVASIGKNWITNYGGDPIPRTKDANDAIALVDSTLWLIAQLMPRWWFVENPRGMLRKFSMMQTRPCHATVTYCQYGDTRMKPTDIWHNNPDWKPRPMCKNGDPCHDRAPRGSRLGTQGIDGAKDRGRVPYDLLKEILVSCMEPK
jgi:hypothetical protein